MSLNNPNFLNNPESDKRQELKRLLESGRFDELTDEVTHRALLTVEISKTRAEYEANHELSFLEDLDWEILTMLRLYDEKTFEHSLNTYEILKQKLEIIKHNDKTLAEIINEEGFSLNELYRAAILHDAGKIKIPFCVINNPVTRGEWREIFDEQKVSLQKSQLIKLLGNKEWADPEEILKIEALRDETDVKEDTKELPDKDYNDIAEHFILEESRQHINEYLKAKLIPATQLVPISKGMSKENIQILIERGFSPDEPLGAIMRRHEKFSGDVLTNIYDKWKQTAGYNYSEETLNKIIELATHHHNYDCDKQFLAEHPASVTSLNISNRLSSLISMADLKEAMESHARAYRQGEADLVEIFQEFIIHADRGFIDKHYTALWLDSDLKELGPKEQKELENDRKVELEIINKWIAENIK